MTLEEHNQINLLIKQGYLAKDLEPLTCTKCGSDQMVDNIKAIDGGHVSEKECRCDNCNTMLGYWVQGSWQV